MVTNFFKLKFLLFIFLFELNLFSSQKDEKFLKIEFNSSVFEDQFLSKNDFYSNFMSEKIFFEIKKEIKENKDKTLFSLNPENIQDLKMELPNLIKYYIKFYSQNFILVVARTLFEIAKNLMFKNINGLNLLNLIQIQTDLFKISIPTIDLIVNNLIPFINDENRRIEIFKNQKNSKVKINTEKDGYEDFVFIFIPGTASKQNVKDIFFHAVLNKCIFTEKKNAKLIQFNGYNLASESLSKDYLAYPYQNVHIKYGENYFILDWNRALCQNSRNSTAIDLFNDFNSKIKLKNKKIVIIAHSYGGEVAIKFIDSLFFKNNFKNNLYLCLLGTPLNNDTSKILINNLKKNEKFKLILFHAPYDFVATKDPTNYENFGNMSIKTPSDLHFYDECRREKIKPKNVEAFLIFEDGKTIKQQLEEAIIKKTTLHGLLAKNVFETNLFIEIIEKFDELEGTFNIITFKVKDNIIINKKTPRPKF